MPEDLTRDDAPRGPGYPAAQGPVAALRLQVTRQQASLDRQADRLAGQTAQIAQLAARLRDGEARIGGLIPEVQALQHEVAALRGEVAALRASNSWRITWPLRALRRGWWRVSGWLEQQGRALRDRNRQPPPRG